MKLFNILFGVIVCLALTGCSQIKLKNYADNLCAPACFGVATISANQCSSLCSSALAGQAMDYAALCGDACMGAAELGETSCVDLCQTGVTVVLEKVDAE
jgi:hypothetical protein